MPLLRKQGPVVGELTAAGGGELFQKLLHGQILLGFAGDVEDYAAFVHHHQPVAVLYLSLIHISLFSPLSAKTRGTVQRGVKHG